MPSWFISLFMFLMGAGFIAVAIDQAGNGVVKWRGGDEAATREKNPGSFWGVIVFEIIVGVVLLWRSMA